MKNKNCNLNTNTIYKGGKTTLTERINSLEEVITHLSGVIEERKRFKNESMLYCKTHVSQNQQLRFIVDIYNNAQMRIIDDKIKQMQHLAKLDGYLSKMFEDGNYSLDELKRSRHKQELILQQLNSTRYSIENMQELVNVMK